MLKVREAGVWLAMVGVALAVQGCWENEQDQLTLLGNGGCRTADGSVGNPKTTTGISLDTCRALCDDGDVSCVAVEYSANTETCEIHSEPITKFERIEGVVCYVVE